MYRETNNKTIESLRALAFTLDLRLGVDARKQILAGNEKITLSTDEQGWKAWMTGVEERLKIYAGAQMADEMLASTWWVPLLKKSSDAAG